MATKTSKSGKQTKSASAKKTAAPAKAAPAKAKARPAPAPAPSAPAPLKTPAGHFTPEQRHHMIADAAYYLALRRGPSSDPLKNWLDAEREIDGRIGWPPPKR